MSETTNNMKNGTVEVATLRDKGGSYFLAVIHANRNGEPEVIGRDYVSIDEAKSAAWTLARQLNASVLPTKRRV
jgi:hypothetical protein